MKIDYREFWKQRVADQEQWIKDHGGDLAGYVARYGSASDAEHSGNGGEAIFAADMEELQRLGRNVR